jgi:hypothetical protein
VQGAGIHHNPTPGPAGEKFVYGHIWVTLAWLYAPGGSRGVGCECKGSQPTDPQRISRLMIGQLVCALSPG